jgi:hypothetical protein
VAIVGPTGSGKTSLAIQLVARGARFVTDDVLAIDRDDGRLRAHPGAGIASVRPAERALIPRTTWRRLGTVLGRSGKTYVALPTVHGPIELGAVCFLDSAGRGPAIESLTRPDPRQLLGSTFVLGVQTPKRLRNQLDVCAAVAKDVPTFAVRVRPGENASQLAETVHERLLAR